MRAAPVSIAFIVNSLRFGGAEKHTLQLFNGLASQGFKATLAYLKREEHLLHEADPASGPVWCADYGRGWDFAGLRRLADWIRNSKPDVLVCVNTYPLFYGHLARRLSGHRCRIVEIFHSTELPAREDRQMRWVYRPFFNYSDRIAYVSTAQRAYWEARGLHKDRGEVIHNGIDAERYRDVQAAEDKAVLRGRFGFTADDYVVGICAALRTEKRHEDLIEAIARLKSEGGMSVKCLIIGDGPHRAAIEDKITGMALEGDVAITGFQTDVRPFITACDCMAIVSQMETFSIAALESMALGKPMVMSAIGGAAEQVRNGDNGYLFPAGDVEALMCALRELADPVHRAELGKNARLSVERDFGLQTMLDKYARLFGETTARASRP
jgi:glycosyltransferase involved in cell wall biosynthesis